MVETAYHFKRCNLSQIAQILEWKTTTRTTDKQYYCLWLINLSDRSTIYKIYNQLSPYIRQFKIYFSVVKLVGERHEEVESCFRVDLYYQKEISFTSAFVCFLVDHVHNYNTHFYLYKKMNAKTIKMLLVSKIGTNELANKWRTSETRTQVLRRTQLALKWFANCLIRIKLNSTNELTKIYTRISYHIVR